MKTCTKCKVEKSTAEFHKHVRRRDGLCPRCKQCTNEDNAQWRNANPEKFNAANKAYQKANPEKYGRYKSEYQKANPKRYAKYAERYRTDNPEKVAAHTEVNNAIKSGVLEKPRVCTLNNSRCNGRLEAHHSDYRKPLDVLWLCKVHHTAWHRFLEVECKH